MGGGLIEMYGVDMARIFVSTYEKYNNGRIIGQWVDLADYSDKNEFLKACYSLNADEGDPELMFQDFEDVPEGMASESHISPEIWDYMALSESDQEIFSLYRKYIDETGDIPQALESYLGEYSSKEEWAEEWLEESGILDQVPECLRYHIDFSSFARDAQLGGDVYFTSDSGVTHVFRNS